LIVSALASSSQQLYGTNISLVVLTMTGLTELTITHGCMLSFRTFLFTAIVHSYCSQLLFTAIAFRAFANRFLKAPAMSQYVEQSVELGYAFDVHCNAFFPLLLVLHVLQIICIKGTAGSVSLGFPLPYLSDHPYCVASPLNKCCEQR
jgi:hypothetical protein